jgi:predicted nucleic acid-binding protein
MIYYFDSSGIVKRYVAEAGSGWVLVVTDPAAGNEIFVARISCVEVVSALVRKNPALSASDLTLALTHFKYDFQNLYQQVALQDAVLNRAMSLVEKHHLRGYDSVQLAGAVEMLVQSRLVGIPGPIFVSADLRLLAAARSEGLMTEDPASHP